MRVTFQIRTLELFIILSFFFFFINYDNYFYTFLSKRESLKSLFGKINYFQKVEFIFIASTCY